MSNEIELKTNKLNSFILEEYYKSFKQTIKCKICNFSCEKRICFTHQNENVCLLCAIMKLNENVLQINKITNYNSTQDFNCKICHRNMPDVCYIREIKQEILEFSDICNECYLKELFQCGKKNLLDSKCSRKSFIYN